MCAVCEDEAMTGRGKIFLTILSVPLVLYALYKWNYPTISWNQRMIVEVDVNGEIVSGSSVTQVSYRFYAPWLALGGGVATSRMHGEAVYVDMGERGYLFALLRSEGSVDYLKNIAQNLFRRELPRSHVFSRALQRMRIEFGSRELSRDDYPMLVTFTDINDPTTVQLVDPGDLATTFGEDVELKRITLAITGDWVTDGIEDVLGWLSEYRQNGYRLDGERRAARRNSLDNLPGMLGPGSFEVVR